MAEISANVNFIFSDRIFPEDGRALHRSAVNGQKDLHLFS